ncbi:MAG: carboxypeptidase regulatory-like domain-containing protein, partial [Planctomycetales bacterium]|nr:carboxypeptidase regulatory-like domain-containing protein [Planctomycetales bacterium]
KRGTSDVQGKVRFENLIGNEELKRHHDALRAGELPYFTPGFVVVAKAAGRAAVMSYRSEIELARSKGETPLLMPAAIAVVGRVVDEQGSPVSGAEVRIGPYRTIELPDVGVQTTDEEGRFQFQDVAAAPEEKPQRAGDWLLLPADGQAVSTVPDSQPVNPSTSPDRLVVSVAHPDFAVTQVMAPEPPLTLEVTLSPPGQIVGQVLDHATRAPVAGALVRAFGKLGDDRHVSDLADLQLFSLTGMHNATTRTDAQGRYRLRNLPAGNYEVHAADEGVVWDDVAWVSPGAAGVEVVATEIRAVTLEVGPPAVARIQLIDVDAKQPISFDDDGVLASGFVMRARGPQMVGNPMAQNIPVSRKGVFELPFVPGDVRLGAFVRGPGDSDVYLWQTPDDIHRSGQVVHGGFGERLNARVEVVSGTAIARQREVGTKIGSALSRGAYDEALQLLDAFESEASLPTSMVRLRAMIYGMQGDAARALAEYEKLLSSNVTNPAEVFEVRLPLASILTTSNDDQLRDGKRALELLDAVRDPELRNDFNFQRLLAAAYAENGDFAKAVETEQAALDSLPSEAQKQIGVERLELYKSGQPYRKNK